MLTFTDIKMFDSIMTFYMKIKFNNNFHYFSFLNRKCIWVNFTGGGDELVKVSDVTFFLNSVSSLGVIEDESLNKMIKWWMEFTDNTGITIKE